MKKTEVRCPALCFVLEENKQPIPGMLHESEEGKMMCLTSGCAFAYIDEHKVEHWMGGQVKMWEQPK